MAVNAAFDTFETLRAYHGLRVHYDFVNLGIIFGLMCKNAVLMY